jgi:hypothetical protein
MAMKTFVLGLHCLAKLRHSTVISSPLAKDYSTCSAAEAQILFFDQFRVIDALSALLAKLRVNGFLFHMMIAPSRAIISSILFTASFNFLQRLYAAWRCG